MWPFLTFNVAFGKFSFWWLIKHENRHFFHFGQNVVRPLDEVLVKGGPKGLLMFQTNWGFDS